MDLRLSHLSRMLPARASFQLNARFLRCPSPSLYRSGRVGKVSLAPRCSISTSTPAVSFDNELLEAGKGWTDARGVQDERILNHFHQLASLASDRVEMHKILADQRDNWNHLFHTTITITSVSAASVLAMNGQMQAPGLSLVAIILNVACAALMTLVNLEQPSQLAEEQRRAARFFRRLRVEIEATLKIDPQLREDASAYWEEKVGTLHALDDAFPLPLSPQGLEKFPKRVVPPELCPDCHGEEVTSSQSSSTSGGGQWTPLTEAYVRQVSARLAERDIPQMIGIAEKAKLVNFWLARISPVLAAGSALINVMACAGVLSASYQMSWIGATMSVLAFLSHSVSHALQLGSFFEVHRTHAGFYAEIQKTVARALELPRQRREDLKLFLLKLNLKLGHSPGKQAVHKNNHDADRLL